MHRIPSQGIEYIQADKAMNDPRTYILEISAPSATNKLLPAFLYTFFENAGLNIKMNEVPPLLYIKIDSQDLLERLSDEKWRKNKLMKNFRISDLYLNKKNI